MGITGYFSYDIDISQYWQTRKGMPFYKMKTVKLYFTVTVKGLFRQNVFIAASYNCVLKPLPLLSRTRKVMIR